MTDDRNLSTEYQPEGGAKHPKDTLDRGPGSDSGQPESPVAGGGSGGDPGPSTDETDDVEQTVREH